jgi:putative salt-induced outer membrane protein YdiY
MLFFLKVSVVFLVIFLTYSVALGEVFILQNGDTLSGKIVKETDDSITLEHKILGVLTLPKSKLQADAGMAVSPEPVRKPPIPGVFGTGFLEGWNRRVALGVKGEEGNDVSFNFNGAFVASYEDQANRLTVGAAYFYEAQNKEKNTSKGNASYVRDWLFPETPWFYYFYSKYDYDEFKLWEHRVSLIGGTGYGFIDEEKLKLHGRIGLGGNRTWGSENEFTPEAQLGIEFRWLPNGIHAVATKFFIFPDLNEVGEYRTQTQAKWEINLSIARGLGLELGIEHEYESQLDDGSDHEKHFDLLYFGRIGIDL